MANTKAIWQQAAHTTDQLAFPGSSTRAKQKSLPLKKYNLKKSGEFEDKYVRRVDHQQK